jgi:Flp pilus assembly protein TadB
MSLPEKNSLTIIEEMINKARNQFSEDGFVYLLWGWVILICSVTHFVLDVFIKFQRPWYVWGITWFVAIYMIYYLRRKERRQIVRTYTQDILKFVWLSFVIMMVISFFILQKFIPEFWRYNYMFILLCYGMPTFLSGIILQFRPLIFGGILCWALAVFSGFANFHYHPLFVAIAVIGAWIIPGYLLRSRYKREMK